jgi:selenium-binding protein 1
MMDLGKLIKDAEAMKHFGNTMVLWNLKSMQPEKIFGVPGAPLEIRWSLREDDDWAITFSALTSKLWLINHNANNEWQAKEVATIGDPAEIPMPVDASISTDAKTLWVNILWTAPPVCSTFYSRSIFLPKSSAARIT